LFTNIKIKLFYFRYLQGRPENTVLPGLLDFQVSDRGTPNQHATVGLLPASKIIMPKVTLTDADGTTTDFFPQSYTDVAVAAASVAPIAIDATEVDLVLADGSTKKFVPAA
jgi:hypothetical protein